MGIMGDLFAFLTYVMTFIFTMFTLTYFDFAC